MAKKRPQQKLWPRRMLKTQIGVDHLAPLIGISMTISGFLQKCAYTQTTKRLPCTQTT